MSNSNNDYPDNETMDEDETSLSNDDDEEEYREVDPMQVIEDRLMVLEAWLHEDASHEDVHSKRDEYLSLMEELEILGKKMRKTDKLLALSNQPNSIKLQRKKEQYEREVTDIVLYAEQDAFFDMEGENGEAALNAYMKANSLLGKPLETLAEMSGFEDSKAWNDSFGPLDARSDAGSTNASASASASASATENNHTATSSSQTSNSPKSPKSGGIPESNLDMSKPHNVTVMKKKLKKVKQMLEDATTEKERTKLLKKIHDYKVVLKYEEKTSNGKDNGNGNDHDDHTDDHGDESSSVVDEESNASEESIDPPLKSPMAVLPTIKTSTKAKPKTKTTPEDDYRLLKKKLTKVTKLLQTANNSKELHKFQNKVDEYLSALSNYPAWKKDQLAYGYGTKQSVQEHDDDTEMQWMEQQAMADEERLVQQEQHQQDNERRRSQAKSMLGAAAKTKSNQDNITTTTNTTTTNHNTNDHDASLDLETYIDEERKQAKILRKKLKKVEEMMEQMLEKQGDEGRYTKEYRKLLKKRKQYLKDLGEDYHDEASLSMSGSMMNLSSSMNLSGHGSSSSLHPHDNTSGSVDISLADLGYIDNNNENENDDDDEDAEEREYRKQQEELALERQQRRQERLAAAAAAAGAAPQKQNLLDETNPDVQLLRKKLKKLDKMLQQDDIRPGTKEYDKLIKKKRQYLAELGENNDDDDEQE